MKWTEVGALPKRKNQLRPSCWGKFNLLALKHNRDCPWTLSLSSNTHIAILIWTTAAGQRVKARRRTKKREWLVSVRPFFSLVSSRNRRFSPLMRGAWKPLKKEAEVHNSVIVSFQWSKRIEFWDFWEKDLTRKKRTKILHLPRRENSLHSFLVPIGDGETMNAFCAAKRPFFPPPHRSLSLHFFCARLRLDDGDFLTGLCKRSQFAPSLSWSRQKEEKCWRPNWADYAKKKERKTRRWSLSIVDLQHRKVKQRHFLNSRYLKAI